MSEDRIIERPCCACRGRGAVPSTYETRLVFCNKCRGRGFNRVLIIANKLQVAVRKAHGGPFEKDYAHVDIVEIQGG